MIRHYTVFVKAPLRAAASATGIFDVDVGTCFRPVLLASPAISWWTLTEMEWPIWMDPSSLSEKNKAFRPLALLPKKQGFPFFLQEKQERNLW